MNKKNLIVFEINEFDYKFFIYGSKKYKFPQIKNFFKLKKKNTITKDNKEGLNLDPWVQWVSAHTGKDSNKHKVLRIGQVLDKDIRQVWEKLPNKKRVSVWGLFNSILRKKNNIDLFYPDPWSFTQKAYPENLNSFLALPRYYAKNYPNFNLSDILNCSLKLLNKVLFSGIIFFIIKNIISLTSIFFRSGLSSFNIYFLFDLFSLILLREQLNKNRSDLVIIGLNSFAHYQHNYWNEKKYEKIYFWYLNQMIIEMNKISQNYNSKIVFNGFSQKKVKVNYYPRIIDQKKFFKDLKINYIRHEINMTYGGTIYFKSLNDKYKAIKILKQIGYNNKRLFDVSDFNNEKKIFYSINFVFINKKNFKEINKLPKKNIVNDKFIFKKIIKNIKLNQSTSRHLQNGLIFFSSEIKLKKTYFIRNYFYNQKLYNLILDYFKN
ncbi:hypothetical protein AKH19_05935 [Pelagibacteraceae bacterium GOM-A1]|nr:hypothetical protein AKH19_05935 [Pelagibacteraceae bacterium GOM-A1]